jgi:hypothetical protein
MPLPPPRWVLATTPHREGGREGAPRRIWSSGCHHQCRRSSGRRHHCRSSGRRHHCQSSGRRHQCRRSSGSRHRCWSSGSYHQCRMPGRRGRVRIRRREVGMPRRLGASGRGWRGWGAPGHADRRHCRREEEAA